MDIEKIEQLIQVVKGSEVSELSLESADGKVRIRKGHVQRHAQSKKLATEAAKKPVKVSRPASVPQSAVSMDDVISAPMVGIFHSFNGSVVIGNEIQSGQIVGSIESMKLMNDVTANCSGTILEVLVEDGMPVEYGQALLRLVSN